MMLDIIRGHTRNDTIARQLAEKLWVMDLDGTLYLGYPILATADEKIEVDALLVSREHGLVAFILGSRCPRPDEESEWNALEDEQDRLYFAIKNTLGRHKDLRAGRDLALEISTVIIFPVATECPDKFKEIEYSDLDHLSKKLADLPSIDEPILRPLQAALQRVTTIKPLKKRLNVKKSSSRGALLKQIEVEIANLDRWQKAAAIETPDGPQRIRGLAGSGKTVVLALKAAYLHTQHPEWTIGVTFHSRSLYQQITDLIRRFTFEHLMDEPNWENLRVLHSWGGTREGVYTQIAAHLNVDPRDFLYAKNRYGMDNAFDGICKELLAIVKEKDIEPLYDAVLIDEAQDLPPSFFQLVYHFTRPPKRIIWAYDELQRLSETSMQSTEDLFGRDKQGLVRVCLQNTEGQARQDIILSVCYRNTPWALTLAHALGFGIYRKQGFVPQHFDEPELWTEIGYEKLGGELALGHHVVLKRSANSYPAYFRELLNPDDAVVAKVFSEAQEQAEWVAREIQHNLEEDELEHDDILLILPNAYTAKKHGVLLIEALMRRGIPAHLAGVTSSQDEIFRKQSVAIAHIYRSKGNEAPMVYVLNCQQCTSGNELTTLRNILFTAITRCRAWVRICGWGAEMETLKLEIDTVRQKKWQLDFNLPTKGDLEKMRMIHRERTAAEKGRIKKAERGLKEFLDAVQEGDIALENLPLELRTGLANIRREQEVADDDVF